MYNKTKKISLRILWSAVLALTLTSLPWWVHGYGQSIETITQLFAQRNIPIIQTPGIDIAFPSRAQVGDNTDILDPSFWIETLPHTKDKRAAGYLVYPKTSGVTIPIVFLNPKDITLVTAGQAFNHNKYLQEGILSYVWALPDQGVGNAVFAVHSSYATNDTWRYKTAGQAALLAEEGDPLYLYLANDEGDYDLYIYTVFKSREVEETATWILDQNVSKETLTVFTCSPIGTTDKRRVNKAELTEIIRADQLQRHGSAPEVDKLPTTSPKPNTDLYQQQENNEEAIIFQTMSVSLPTVAQESDSLLWESINNNDTTDTVIVWQPKFLHRVTLRPFAYRASLQLLSHVWFKRSNLQQLVQLLDKKIADKTTNTDTMSPQQQKSATLFRLIREIVQKFIY